MQTSTIQYMLIFIFKIFNIFKYYNTCYILYALRFFLNSEHIHNQSYLLTARWSWACHILTDIKKNKTFIALQDVH